MEMQLINETLFKDYSPIKEDTIITKFVPYINIAQKLYIEKILGKPLTEELQDQIKAASQEGATGDEITPDNQALILKIAPALSFYAVYEGLPSHWLSIVNKGVTLRDSENSAPASYKDISWYMRILKDKAEVLASDLIEYLCGCKYKYPLWQPGRGCGCGGTDSEGSAINPLDAGIFIPKK